MRASPINERRALIWAGVVVAALWAGHYILVMRPAADPHAQLAEIERARRQIAAQAVMRRAQDHTLMIEAGSLDPRTRALLVEAERTAQQLDRAQLDALAERERRVRAQLPR